MGTIFKCMGPDSGKWLYLSREKRKWDIGGTLEALIVSNTLFQKKKSKTNVGENSDITKVRGSIQGMLTTLLSVLCCKLIYFIIFTRHKFLLMNISH